MANKVDFELLDSIREKCPATVWSQGAKLSRLKLVEGISETDEEIEMRVHVPGTVVAPTVVLYPKDDDFECDCRSRADVCAHIVACAVSVNLSRKDNKPLPATPNTQTKLLYKFYSKRGAMVLHRVFVAADNKTELLKRPLMEGVKTRVFPFGYKPTEQDLEVDQLIGRALHPDRLLPEKWFKPLFEALRFNPNVTFEDKPIKLVSEFLLPRISILDHGDDEIILKVTAHEKTKKVITNGVCQFGERLYLIGKTNLTGKKLEKLPLSVVYEKTKFAEVAARIVPNLKKGCKVNIKSTRLPKVDKGLKPRLAMDMQKEGKNLIVQPNLVYGDPAVVRIDADKMVFLKGSSVPVRDIAAETALREKLKSKLNLVPGRKVFFTGRDATVFLDKAMAFSDRHLSGSKDFVYEKQQLLPMVNVEGDILDVQFYLNDAAAGQVKGEDQRRTADLTTVLSAWKDGSKMVPLQDGGWAPIPIGWLNKHGNLLADLLDSRDQEEKIPLCALPLLKQFCDDLEMPKKPNFDRIAPLLESFESIPNAQMPPGLTATLREYQVTAVDWLCFLRDLGLGAVLADDMGLGKTLEALCAINGRTLVICPTSVLHNWKSEIAKFRPNLKAHVYHGPKRVLDEDADIILTTYAIMRMDVALLSETKWDSVVLDEAQNIKNSASQTAQAAYRLKGKFLMALSGTPVENRLEELWSLFHFANRGLLGSTKRFANRFVEPIGLGDTVVAKELRDRIKPFVLRRLKQDVAKDLPPRTDQVLFCELDERERNVYDAVRAATSKTLVAELRRGKSVMAALEALLRMRQASCHSGLVPGQEAASSSKLELLMNRLNVTVGGEHKALVFSQWTSLLDKVEPLLKRDDVSFCRLDGSTRDRKTVVDAFQDPAGPKVLLVSLKAGGTGLNLTQADHVFLLDPWWNPAVEDQAADRAHRIGQEKPVMVYRLVAKDTVEEGILELQERKRKLVEQALSEAGAAISLTKEDLLALLE